MGCPYCFRWETTEGGGAKVARESDQVGPESTCATYLAHLSPTGAHGRTSTMLITKDLTPPTVITACKSLAATIFAAAACGNSEPPVLWQLKWEPS